ncbi:MAG: hypothetical protein K1X48_01865 [Burkholderiaceae bacterium]|nr:hypothetical protein [Burkholderiaceae bacterium]
MQFRNICLFISIFFIVLSNIASAEQKPPAARTGLEPAGRNKVAIVQARSLIEVDSSNAVAKKSVVSGPLGQNCSTNVGNTTDNATQPGNKYGPAKNTDQVLVVKGSVINICK